MIGAAEDAGHLAAAQARGRVGHHQHRHPAATAAAWGALPGRLPGTPAFHGFFVAWLGVAVACIMCAVLAKVRKGG